MSAKCETCGRFVPSDTHSVKIHGPRCIAKYESNVQAKIERIRKKQPRPIEPQHTSEERTTYDDPR